MFARSLADGRHSSVTIICSYMEIYNDHLYDLLQPFKKHVGGRSVLVSGSRDGGWGRRGRRVAVAECEACGWQQLTSGASSDLGPSP